MCAVLGTRLGALLVLAIFPLITSPEGGSAPTPDKFLGTVSLGTTCTRNAGGAVHQGARRLRIFSQMPRLEVTDAGLRLVMELNPITRRPFILFPGIYNNQSLPASHTHIP